MSVSISVGVDPKTGQPHSSADPAPVRDVGSRGVAEILAVEAEPLTTNNAVAQNVDYTGATLPGNVSVGTIIAMNVGKAYYIDNLIISANKNCILNVNSFGTQVAGLTGGGNFSAASYSVIVAPGVPCVVPVKMWLRGGLHSDVGLGIRDIFDSVKTNTNIWGTATGFEIADDLNFGASKIILCVGDSKWNGTGPTTKDTFIPWMIRRYYSDKGINCRLVNKSLSSSTAIGHDTMRNRGRYEINRADLICVDLGTNDATINTATAVATTVTNWIAWKQNKYPHAKMIFFGPPPREDATSEAALALIRTAIGNAVTGAADSNIKFCNQGSAFTNTDTSKYVASDPAGNHVHPNDAGITAIWAVDKPFLDANMPTF